MTNSMALFLVVAVLVPLLPAYLLYRLLPSSQADLEGPWQGLKIKVGGAFGGYFLLVVTILGYASLMPRYDVWTVSGQLAFDDTGGVLDEELVRFTLKPSGVFVEPGGSFRLTLFSIPDPSGEPKLPLLIVDHPSYRPLGIDLESRGSKSLLKRLVQLSDTLVLKRIPASTAHVHP